MDRKYGRLFTEEDVLAIVHRVANTGEVRGVEPERLLREMQGLEDGPSPFDDWDEPLSFRFPADEPLFLLRAKDEVARSTIADYWYRCAEADAAEEHLDAVDDVIAAFDKFRREHLESMKVPD